MKILFDQNISFRIVSMISSAFPDSMQVREQNLENATDVEIWQFAKDNGYSIVTFDADFYERSVLMGFPPKIIWLRTGNLTTRKIADLILYNEKKIKLFLSDSESACLQIV